MKFEINYSTAILNHIVQFVNICVEIVTCMIRTKKEEIRKVLNKIKESNYNLTAWHFIERFDNIFM